jgi:hypothetical protein
VMRPVAAFRGRGYRPIPDRRFSQPRSSQPRPRAIPYINSSGCTLKQSPLHRALWGVRSTTCACALAQPKRSCRKSAPRCRKTALAGRRPR